MSPFEITAPSAVKKVFAEESVALTKFLKGKISDKWSIYIGNKELCKYQEKIISYFYFFTINNPDKKSYIDEVYVPINIQTSDGSKFEVESLLNKSRGFSVISGVAGHGKSTFLRHLMKHLIVSNTNYEIPIFFELKYFSDNPIELQITNWLVLNGLKVEEPFVTKLLNEGRLIVFLDAFDELPSDNMDTCEEKIIAFHQKFPDINIIITTRPNLQITKNPIANHYKMADLDAGKIRKVISNVCWDKEEASNAVRVIFSSKFVRDAIKTPILVVLVSLTYKRWLSIPRTMSEFYNRVFNTLLSIHDNSKSGKKISREINTDLEDVQILKVICNLSYYLTVNEKYNFSKLEFDEACSKALNNQSHELSNISPIFKCIKDACNIVILDGFDEYKYIHRSFQEFYTSKYIESLHSNKKKVFYSKCLTDDSFKLKFRKVLDFLFEIDEVYMYELLLIPYLVKNNCVIPVGNFTIDIMRTVNFQHLVFTVLNGKYIANEGKVIETAYAGLYIYECVFGEDVIEELSDAIDEKIMQEDLSFLSSKLSPSHIMHNYYEMFSVLDVVNLLFDKDKFMEGICEQIENDFDDVKSILDNKLDEVFNKIEGNCEEVSDL